MKNSSTQKNFLAGATIIAFSHIIVKIIGALFRVPLANLIGAEGMAIYQSAYSIYLVLFTISTAGLPVAISKMVSEYDALGKEKEAFNVFSVAYRLLFVIGIVGSAILMLGSKTISSAMGAADVAPALAALAPSLLFVSVSSVYRGFFQGRQNMMPTALSEVIEACLKLLVGLVLAYLLSVYGSAGSATGAILGVTIGALASAIFLFIYYNVKKERSIFSKTGLSRKEKNGLLKRIIYIAVPVTLGSSVFTLTSTIDTFMVLKRLQDIGFSYTQAKVMFGYYSGYAVTMFNLPAAVIVGISISIVPAISAAMAINKVKEAAGNIASSVRITWQLAFPAGLGMAALASPILKFLFPTADFVIPVAPEGVSVSSGILSVLNSGGDATKLLTMLGLAISLVCITMLTNSILQALGKVWLPVINMFIGGVVKIIANYVLVGIPGLNIMGAPISTTLCYFIITLLNLICIARKTSPTYGIGSTIIKPLISGVCMVLTAVFSYNFIYGITSSNIIGVGGAIVLAVIVYAGLMLVLKSFCKEDILLLPKGKLIADKMSFFLKQES